jgi:hypothetical protein
MVLEASFGGYGWSCSKSNAFVSVKNREEGENSVPTVSV